MNDVAVAIAAIAIDLAFGDPPNRWHPVAWMGSGLGRGREALLRGSPIALVLGGAMVTVGVSLLAAAGAGVATHLARRAGVVGIGLEAVLLKTMFSLRGLGRAAATVAADLRRGDLVAARESVGRHLVSRPTDKLDEAHVASATVESVAENLTDSFVAPLAFYVVFGLPGAAFYRVVNTADAMFGYREGALEHFGKVAAHLDDVLNYLPARLAGWAVVVGALLTGRAATGAARIMRRDHARPASPNAGWPMAAMAGALRVTLEKRGAYRLGDGAMPDVAHIDGSIEIVRSAALAGTAVAVAALAIGRVPLP